MPETAPAPQSPAAPATDEATDPSVALAERRLAWLGELAEIGMELARALRPGAAPVGETPANDKARDPAEAFAPLSRAIRLTLALEAKTDRELRDLKAGIVRDREARRPKTSEDYLKLRDARETQVERLVMSVIEAESESLEEFEGLYNAMEERLGQDEAYVDLADRPLRETVERLCQDLMLNPDWSRWEGEGWIDGTTPVRPSFSPFNTRSRKPLFNDDGEPVAPSPVETDHDLQ